MARTMMGIAVIAALVLMVRSQNILPDATFDVKITTKKYGDECSWELGSCSSENYDDYDSYTQQCTLAPGVYSLKCKDSVADGWHGGYLEIGGDKYCDDFDEGSEQIKNITVSVPVKGMWSAWSSWGCCNQHYKKQRNRICNRPSPTTLFYNCAGRHFEDAACSTKECVQFNGRLFGIREGITDTAKYVQDGDESWKRVGKNIQLIVWAGGIKIKEKETGVVLYHHEQSNVKYVSVHSEKNDLFYLDGTQEAGFQEFYFNGLGGSADKVMSAMTALFKSTFTELSSCYYCSPYWTTYQLN